MEENPGPTNAELNATITSLQSVVEQLQTEYNELAQKTKYLLETRTDTDKKVSELTERVCTLERKLNASQSDLQDELAQKIREISEGRSGADKKVSELTEQLCTLERELRASQPDIQVAQNNDSKLETAQVELAVLKSRCNDAENRSRRSNLVFFGLEDKDKETWAESESRIIDLCDKKMGIKINPDNIDRAHRIGAFNRAKKRPIVVKFCFFKHKEAVLSSGYRLKDSGFAVSDDFSRPVQLARRKLVEFAKTQNSRFRLRMDRLHINDRCFMFDHESDNVREVDDIQSRELIDTPSTSNQAPIQ